MGSAGPDGAMCDFFRELPRSVDFHRLYIRIRLCVLLAIGCESCHIPGWATQRVGQPIEQECRPFPSKSCLAHSWTNGMECAAAKRLSPGTG